MMSWWILSVRKTCNGQRDNFPLLKRWQISTFEKNGGWVVCGLCVVLCNGSLKRQVSVSGLVARFGTKIQSTTRMEKWIGRNFLDYDLFWGDQRFLYSTILLAGNKWNIKEVIAFTHPHPPSKKQGKQLQLFCFYQSLKFPWKGKGSLPWKSVGRKIVILKS